MPDQRFQTEASRFRGDERVVQGKRLLIEALEEHSSRLSEIRPSNPEMKLSYEALLQQFAQLRGAPLFLPYISSGLGRGAFIELLDGSVKYDMIGGIGCYLLGHSHPKLVEAGLDAALCDTVMQGHLQQTQIAADLMQTLCSLSGMDHCFLTTSGVMANENALKIAFQKRAPAQRIFAFEGCFSGRTLLAAQITDRPQYRKGLPLPFSVDYLPFFDPDKDDGGLKDTLKAIDESLKRYPNGHAAALFELIQGERGFYLGDKAFFTSIINRLKEAGVIIIADEIQTFARTTQLFAFQHYQIANLIDIATAGKTLTACATLFRGDMNPQPGLLGQTFTASTSALYAAKATLKLLTEGGYYGVDGKIARLHERLSMRFEEIAARHYGLLKGPWGCGAMFAFTPFDGKAKQVTAFVEALFDKGVIAFTAGVEPVRARFLLPAAVMDLDQCDQVAALVEQTLLDIKGAL